MTQLLRIKVFAVLSLCGATCAIAFGDASANNMQRIDNLWVDRTEVSIAEFARYVDATGVSTAAERDGGGLVYDGGWQRMSGWTWQTPFGSNANEQLPAVHVSFDEAAAYCAWVGKRLPTDEEWANAAYVERRANPDTPYKTGVTYEYPTGDTPRGANCLSECGDTSAVDFTKVLSRGVGPAPVGSTQKGVNGLYDMGANVWEWTNIDSDVHKGTRGGSWWYGATQMARQHTASKARDMAAVYIGFRCVRPAE